MLAYVSLAGFGNDRDRFVTTLLMPIEAGICDPRELDRKQGSQSSRVEGVFVLIVKPPLGLNRIVGSIR